jgi:anti-anti-sigma regulatory factor
MTSTAKARTQATVTATPSGDVLTISDYIEDNTQLTPYADKLGETPVIDLGGVTFINSVGVREWITLLDELAKRGKRVTLRNVSEPMVRQMTMVVEARGEATVESFFAPYSCPSCGDERTLLINVAEHKAALLSLAPPTLPCGACGADAEFDEFPARYLAFLT